MTTIIYVIFPLNPPEQAGRLLPVTIMITTALPKPETFAKMGSPRTTIEPERETFARNENKKYNNGHANVHESRQGGR